MTAHIKPYTSLSNLKIQHFQYNYWWNYLTIIRTVSSMSWNRYNQIQLIYFSYTNTYTIIIRHRREMLTICKSVRGKYHKPLCITDITFKMHRSRCEIVHYRFSINGPRRIIILKRIHTLLCDERYTWITSNNICAARVFPENLYVRY